MNLNIEILGVVTEWSENKKYEIATVTFKNVQTQKVEAKKIMSFSSPEVYSKLKGAKQGDQFNVELSKTEGKDGRSYWNWIGLGAVEQSNNHSQTGGKEANISRTLPSPKSTYETPEERAKRQELIVRQSSVSSSLEYLKLCERKATMDEVLSFADIIYNWVFQNGKDVKPAFMSDLNDDLDAVFGDGGKSK